MIQPKKVLTTAELIERRRNVDGSVAVVTGTYDLFQPGNLLAIQTAKSNADCVCVVVEPDNVVAGHSSKGRPWRPLDERTSALSFLKDVSMVSSVSLEQAAALFDSLRPYAWITCSERQSSDAYSQAARLAAEETIEITSVSGCSTEEVFASIRANMTPLDIPDTFDPGSIETRQELSRPLVTVNGCFDILHAGHVTYLEQAAQLGDRLIIAVNDDASVKRLKGEERPVNTMERRMRVLAALDCVDWVVPFYEDTPTRLICRTQPDVLVKGGDNDPDKIPGGDCVREAGGEVMVMTYVDNVSTTGLIASIRESRRIQQTSRSMSGGSVRRAFRNRSKDRSKAIGSTSAIPRA